MRHPVPESLCVAATISEEGMDVTLNGDTFPICYPREIWAKYPKRLKEILADNIAYSSTLFVPQMLGLSEIHYETGRPLCETFLFKNGIYDMPITALSDGKSSREYVRAFFNTRPSFARSTIARPDVATLSSRQPPRRAIIPFSFGKESLLSYALCTELGIDPILVLFVEPANAYEHMHKQRLIEAFEHETGTHVHVVQYNPGLLRSGRYFGLKTELGWGLQATEYCILCLPFVHAFEVDLIILGNEQSCNDFIIDQEGMLVYDAAYDQRGEWIPQQSLLASLLLGRSVAVTSFVEPLYELAIMYILHSRYPQVGKFQMSCLAETEHARTCRWCQRCAKCSYVYGLCCACGIGPSRVGFTENLFDEDPEEMYGYFFHYDALHAEYGEQEELGLAFLLAERHGYDGRAMERFRRELRSQIAGNEESLRRKFLGIIPSENIPETLREPLLEIFREELARFPTSPVAPVQSYA